MKATNLKPTHRLRDDGEAIVTRLARARR